MPITTKNFHLPAFLVEEICDNEQISSFRQWIAFSTVFSENKPKETKRDEEK